MYEISILANELFEQDSKMEWTDDLQNSVQSSSMSVSKVIDKLLTENNLEKLQKCVDSSTLISESNLVKIIKLIFNNKNKSKEEDSPPNGNLINPLSTAECIFINKLLHLSYNDAFLAKNLQSLELNDALILLHYFCYLMFTEDTSIEKPSIKILADWTSVLLDSHFNQFIMTSDPVVSSILLDLNVKIKEEYKSCKEFILLDRQINNMKEKYSLPKAQTKSIYVIQILEL
ncbi:Nucleolar protein 11-like [Nymphon striatum]|nr:Nucleolar protein 11-like [Nymphon striatum]KAG1666321.1 Nucleolar protein 11-like [Nymphon striatum]KAG1669711.1 Nucleolar protein 11-like [Nymphon striatum]